MGIEKITASLDFVHGVSQFLRGSLRGELKV